MSNIEYLPSWKRIIRESAPGRPYEVQYRSHFRQPVLMLEFMIAQYSKQLETRAMFRSENTMKFQTDIRVPIPQELYRDVAYHEVDSLLGWDVSAPVIPWEVRKLNGEIEKGVLRPYWDEVTNMQIYDFKRGALLQDMDNFWQKVALLDYVCAVIDRTYNDILKIPHALVPSGRVVIDSGLSFVEGIEFITQQSLIRQALKGDAVDPQLLDDLSKLDENHLYSEISPYVNDAEIDAVIDRIEKILQEGVIL
jgi:hypothetical protein